MEKEKVMNNIIAYKSSFTLLKDNNNYENKIRKILEQFKHEDLSNKVARKWIARCVCEVYEIDASNVKEEEIDKKRMSL